MRGAKVEGSGVDTPMMSFVRRIHFVGIGGVGMSGIAQVLLNLGYRISGSDIKATELTRRLAASGTRVHIGHKASNIRGAQVVVTSSAVSSDNPETQEARKRGIPVVARADMLAELARLKKTITVSGTHGKTTTTSMVAMALSRAGADPTMVIGGQMANIGSNARLGMGEYLVAEADESDGSFLRLFPLVAVVTNIDSDHLDYYGDMGRLKSAFLEHLEKLPFYGAAVLCADDSVLRSLFGKIKRPIISYGLRPGAQWRARIMASAKRGFLRGSRAAVYHRGRKVGVLALKVPGSHNVSNALAAVAVGVFLGFDIRKILTGLSEFSGVGRRMERLGRAGGVDFIDDYGHHPTEIRATLRAVAATAADRALPAGKVQFLPAGTGRAISRPVPRGSAASRRRLGAVKNRRIVVLFQPHRYSRTKRLCREFGAAFSKADVVYVMDVYPAGEKPIPGVGPKLILDSLRAHGKRAVPFTRAVDMVRDLKPGDIVLTQGAGDVWKMGMDLLRRLQGRTLGSV